MLNRHGRPTALCVAVVLIAAASLAARDLPDRSPQPTAVPYVTVSFNRHAAGGEFAGTQIISSVKGFFAIPEVSDGPGWGVAAGLRNNLLGVEAGFARSEHEVTLPGSESDAVWSAVTVQGQLYAPTLGPFRPFMSLGMSMEWLSVDDAYCSDSTNMQCAARFEGLGVSVGPGLLARLRDGVFISARLAYRHIDFDTIEAYEAADGTLPYAVEAEGWGWSTGIGLEF